MWWRLRASLARFSLARGSLARASLARFTLTRFQFDAFHFGTMPVWRVSLWRLIQYSRQFSFFSAKASLARVAYLFVRMFPFCACFLRRSVAYASLPRSHSTRPTLARVSLSAYFSFMRRIVCVIYLLIISTRHRATA